MANIMPMNSAGVGPKGIANPVSKAALQAQNNTKPSAASGSVARPCAVAQVRGLRSACARSQSALRIGYQVQQTTAPTASTWATAQGIATLPLALLGYAAFWLWSSVTGSQFTMPLGPTPWPFVGLMFAIGLFASWLGTLCWNEASQRLPPALAGQLIVFETLAALAYALVLRGQAPAWATLAGAALLVAGVVWALRIRPQRTAALAESLGAPH